MAAKDFSELECQGRSVSPSLVLFITCCVLIQAPYVRCWRVNCSQPDTLSILDALRPAMNLSSVRPVRKLSTSTNVIISFTLYGILGVDEKAQVFSTYIWQTFKWDNEFISWDPVQCGTETISLPRTKFWVPDVVINEFMDENTAPFVPYVVVDYTGRVRDAYPVRVVSSCNLNIYTFPFDIQNCTLTFNSYVHPVSDVRMVLGKPAEKILKRSKEVMTTMGEWELLDITSHKYQMGGTVDNPWDALTFNIVVRRRATLYVVNLLIPSCFLITVDLFSFLLPPQNVDRSSFKMTLILGYTVFLLIMNDLLPVTGNTIPLINVFFSVCLSLMVASLLETVFITNLLVGSSDFRPVPRWVYVFVIRFLGPLVCLPPKPREQDTVILNPAAQEVNACPLVVVESQTQVKAPGEKETKAGESSLEELRKLGRDLQAIRLQVDKHLTVSQSSEEWIQVGYIIDRLLFGSYIIFISVSFITIIGIWVSSYNAHSK